MKRGFSKWMVLLVATALSGFLLSGCAWSIGDQKDGKAVIQPTRGQELTDLKKARDQGAISEEEYQAERKKILER